MGGGVESESAFGFEGDGAEGEGGNQRGMEEICRSVLRLLGSLSVGAEAEAAAEGSSESWVESSQDCRVE